MKITVLFLGRSIEGILADAHREGLTEGAELVVVARDGDKLAPPAEVEDRVIPVSDFSVDAQAEYTVVANGGSSAQLVPVLLRLARAGAPLTVFDLQRDGCTQLS